MHNPSETQEGGSSLRVLLADDSRVNQHLLAGILKHQGHQVTVAQNGKEAVDAFQSHEFDLVLMDVEMPEMDGLEATRRIRDLESRKRVRIPIVAVTTLDDRDICLAAGMDELLVKPARPDRLREIIERATRNAAARGKRILLVDDDPQIVEALRHALEQCGHAVTIACDGHQALTMAEIHRPDLIVLDVVMPKCSGLAVLEKIGASGLGAIPVIVITGSLDVRQQATAIRLGAHEFFHKPFEIAHFVETVNRCLA